MSTASNSSGRRVVVTGIGLICPLGSTPNDVWAAFHEGRSGVSDYSALGANPAPLRFAGEARQFTGGIDDFGPLEGSAKKAIRKGLKLMCRETQMAVAAAQLALADAGCAGSPLPPERSGVVLGSDYMLTMPGDYASAIAKCSPEGRLQFDRWGQDGLDDMQPLWMLKYLPNMPASHIAIYNDLRGPNNSITMREASGLMAIGEAFRTIARGHADHMIAGATGTRVLPMQAIHAAQSEEIATDAQRPEAACRPFDRDRCGMVAGEGAAMIVLEEKAAAERRGASILGEVVGFGTSSVADRRLHGKLDAAMKNAIRAALADAGLSAAEIGHINAHGLATRHADRAEAAAIQEVFGGLPEPTPVIALKSYFGNLGAGSGVVELIGSLLSAQHGALPRVLNYENPDPECPVAVVKDESTHAGSSFLKLNVTPQGQAAAIALRT